MKTKLMALAAAIAVSLGAWAEPTVTDITAKQRYPWNGLVDISCKVSGIEADTGGYEFVVVAVDKDTGKEYTVSDFSIQHNGEEVPDVCGNGDYSLLWNAREDMGQVVVERMIVRITLEALAVSVGKVQLWEGGPYWADRNVGASRPEDYGLYFWWGDTVGHRPSADGKFSFNFYYSNSAIYTYGKSVSELQSSGWVTSDSVLAPKHDAAHVKWGGAWRIPTIEELSGLHNNCVWTWTTMNDVKGLFIRGKGAYSSNSIFLPAVGYGDGASRSGYGFGTYWSSEPCIYYDSDRDTSGDLQFGDGYVFYFTTGRRNRWYGYSVRPVQ